MVQGSRPLDSINIPMGGYWCHHRSPSSSSSFFSSSSGEEIWHVDCDGGERRGSYEPSTNSVPSHAPETNAGL